ncbi:helix-turn-helix and ligand-binding sensor domain-containing protein [Flavobacterium daejeonense]|uniref:helix-turn-helix and ligand-binding sensor domain-containing protein n=1 Tax=Flavobacterium daejeonense TaxID=350893 RepID=UPI00047E22A3|nr:transcriptional regulator [Flavobacterium daejeonense]
MTVSKFIWVNIIFGFFFMPFVAHNAKAQFTPGIRNFLLSDYEGGNHNWDVSRAKDGRVYVANDYGLLEFDGIKWDLFELPNKTVVRSVLAHNGLVYGGSHSEFGYWKKDKRGVFSYKSLSSTIEDRISHNEDIWQILSYRKDIVFRSFENIYIYKPNGQIIKISPKSAVISCSAVNEKMYVATLNHGIFELRNDKLEQKIYDLNLSKFKIVSITNYKKGLLIVTSKGGCFTYIDNELRLANFKINSFIQQHLLSDFTKLKNGQMVFGTIKDGVYVTNVEGEILFHINKVNGLNNNTVLGQSIDAYNKLWLGLDNGIAYIDLDRTNYLYNDISGKLGAVYDVISYKNTVYIGSNTGLFYLNKNDELKFIEGSQGQVWDLKEIEGELFCGHNEGTFIVDNFKLKKISNHTGGWTIKKTPETPNVYIQSTYIGFVKFKKKNNEWNAKHISKTSLSPKFNTMPIKYFVFQDKNTIWAAQAYKGLYRVKFDDNFDSIIAIKDYGKKFLKSDYNVRVYKIKNEICFKTNGGWYKYEAFLDSIVPHKFLNEKVGKKSNIISDDNLDFLVYMTDEKVINFSGFSNEYDTFSLKRNFYENRLIVGNERISKISNSIYALNLYDGFMLINRDYDYTNLPLQSPVLDRVEINNKSKVIAVDQEIEAAYNESVVIYVSSPKSENHYFEYRIQNFTPNRWIKLRANKLELSNLKDGDYHIELRTVNSLGKISKLRKLTVSIMPPWYKSYKGGSLYFVLLMCFLAFMYSLYKKKMFNEQRRLKLELERKQRELLREKTIENEKRIIQLKNEALKNELNLKSKQLANTAMALVKKNESILDIKNELINAKNAFEDTYIFRKLMKKMDSSIEQKDEWEVFEYNFNQVHEVFFDKLKAQFPNLKPKDLKMCAYIKMNLSNKEIAPLMNISVRGVETIRYRLKSKLNLENEISLSDFLINFN